MIVSTEISVEGQTLALWLTLSTVGSTRALFFRGGCVGSPPELVPSPAPGAARTEPWDITQSFYKMPAECCLYLNYTRWKNTKTWCTYSSVCSFWFSCTRNNVLKQKIQLFTWIWVLKHQIPDTMWWITLVLCCACSEMLPKTIDGHWQQSLCADPKTCIHV